MPVAALRASARLRPQDVHHLGLRFDRFLASHGDEATKAALLGSIGVLPASVAGVYSQCLDQFRNLLRLRDAVTREWSTSGRLCFGAGDETVLEVGIRFQRTYGVPVIPGSAQKGLVRRWANRLAGAEAADALLGRAPSDSDPGHAAAVMFHDALWVPGGPGPFDLDTITVHHPKYYQGTADATDWDSPTPISLLSAQGRFLFAIEGTKQSASLAMRILGTALRYDGIGAKTLKGYGRFEIPDGDCVLVPEQAQGLFASEPARSSKPIAVVPAARNVLTTATVRRDPGRGVFKFDVHVDGKKLTAETRLTNAEIFPGDAEDTRATFRDSLISRLKRRDALQVEVEVVIDGNMATVVRVIKG